MKKTIAVLFGGKSTEHEISIISALQAIPRISRQEYDVVPVYITKEGDYYIGDSVDRIESYRDIPALLSASTRVIWVKDGERVYLMRYPMKRLGNNVAATVDIAFPIVHGTNVEDGVLQGFLSTLGLPVVGSDVLSSAVGMNKYVMKAVLKDNGIPVLDCLRFTWRDYEDAEAVVSRIEAAYSYPVIIKPLNLGSSIGISKASDRDSLVEALELAFTFSRRILAEPAVVHLKEINCSVLGDYEDAEASECEEPVGGDDILSFEDKYIGGTSAKGAKSAGAAKTAGSAGMTKTGSGSKGMASLKRKIPADISAEKRDEIREMAVRAFQVLGCSGVARIDFLMDMDSGELYFNEINTIPGSLAFYLWEPLGVSYEELLSRMITLALKQDREDHRLVTSFETNVLEGVQLGGAKART